MYISTGYSERAELFAASGIHSLDGSDETEREHSIFYTKHFFQPLKSAVLPCSRRERDIRYK